MGKILLYLKNFDWPLFFIIIFLASFGLIELYSISLGQEAIEAQKSIAFLNFKKQMFFVSIGIVLLFIFSFLDYDRLKRFTKYIYRIR